MILTNFSRHNFVDEEGNVDPREARAVPQERGPHVAARPRRRPARRREVVPLPRVRRRRVHHRPDRTPQRRRLACLGNSASTSGPRSPVRLQPFATGPPVCAWIVRRPRGCAACGAVERRRAALFLGEVDVVARDAHARLDRRPDARSGAVAAVDHRQAPAAHRLGPRPLAGDAPRALALHRAAPEHERDDQREDEQEPPDQPRRREQAVLCLRRSERGRGRGGGRRGGLRRSRCAGLDRASLRRGCRGLGRRRPCAASCAPVLPTARLREAGACGDAGRVRRDRDRREHACPWSRPRGFCQHWSSSDAAHV